MCTLKETKNKFLQNILKIYLKTRRKLKMRKKVLAVVSALVITTLAFTGCGGNKSASSDNGSD